MSFEEGALGCFLRWVSPGRNQDYRSNKNESATPHVPFLREGNQLAPPYNGQIAVRADLRLIHQARPIPLHG
jgi:hypothetical protein